MKRNILCSVFLLIALFAIAGCKKTPPPLPPAELPPPPATPAPRAQISATPAVISAGDQVQLSWRTSDATSVSIDGIGDVPTSGVKTVTPPQSTTYHLVARNQVGSADASVRVTVNAPVAVTVPPKVIDEEEEFKANMQDIFFDYDTADIRSDAESTLGKDAGYLNSHPNIKIVIGGYCYERGSNEYNLTLGQNRAEATMQALQAAGVAPGRMRVVSYGKEKPFCSESTPECWQLNRRAGFTMQK